MRGHKSSRIAGGGLERERRGIKGDLPKRYNGNGFLAPICDNKFVDKPG